LWALLAVVVACAFVDETTYLHQSIGDAMRNHLHTGGIISHPWAVLYVPVGMIVGGLLLRDLGRLAPEHRHRILPAGVVYAIGAIGFEPLKSALDNRYGEGTLPYKLAAFVSDSTELIGLALLAGPPPRNCGTPWPRATSPPPRSLLGWKRTSTPFCTHRRRTRRALRQRGSPAIRWRRTRGERAARSVPRLCTLPLTVARAAETS
jgi:hypothetical protein